MIPLKDRYIATLLGVHIGDSIWAPFEIKTSDEVQKMLESKGLVFHRYKYDEPGPEDWDGNWLPAGRPTDDSDQTADLCDSLLENNGLNEYHLRIALKQSAIYGKSRLWHGTAFGIGSTTRAMLGDDEAVYQATLANPYPSNGSLMRSAPLALWLGPSLEGEYPTLNSKGYELIKAASRVTHTHVDSIATCWLYVRMLRNALADRDIADIEPSSRLDERILIYLDQIDAGNGLPKDPGSFKNGWADAEYTLKVALHAIRTTNTFEEAILDVGLAGGDTDTYGAVTGGLAGAIYGSKAIPRSWRNAILGKKPMQQYAESIYTAFMKPAT